MNDPVVVSYSELATFRQCPLKHRWAYTERWTRPMDPGSARSTGTLWHLVMAAHYNTLLQAQRTMRRTEMYAERNALKARCREAVAEVLADLDIEEADKLVWMYAVYTNVHGLDLNWKILATELRVEVPMLRPDGTRSRRYRIKAVIDLVIQELTGGTIEVVDHKSGSNLPTDLDLDLDDQFGLYTWILRQERESRGLKPLIAGSLHNAIRTYRHKTPVDSSTLVSRTPMHRTKEELDAIAVDAYLAAVASRSKRPPYSSTDPRVCGWKCDYTQAHLLERKGVPHAQTLDTYGFVQDWTRH